MSGTMRKSVQTVCGRALRGLYGGRTIRFGNNVSEQGGNKCAPPTAALLRPQER
jgi:hypothetical protein